VRYPTLKFQNFYIFIVEPQQCVLQKWIKKPGDLTLGKRNSVKNKNDDMKELAVIRAQTDLLNTKILIGVQISY